MKYLKLFEYSSFKTEEKEGDKIAKKLQSIINKYLGVNRNFDLHITVSFYSLWLTFKYDFDPYIFIEFENKGVSQKEIDFISEMDRLNCHPNNGIPETKRTYQLTKQQLEELFISFENGLPFKEISRIYNDDTLYTYKNFERAFHNVISRDQIITGKLNKDMRKNIRIIGLDKKDKFVTVTIKSKYQCGYTDKLKYVRKATPEEIEEYETKEMSLKYNL